MNSKLLSLLLLVMMAAPEAFADRRDRRGGSSVSNSRGGNGGGATARANRGNRGGNREARRANRSTRRDVTPNRVTRNDRRTARRTDRRVERRADRRVERRADRRVERRADRRVERRVNRQINRRIDRRVNRRINRYRPVRSYYGTRNYHRPYNYVTRPYSRYFHSPYRHNYVHRTRYQRPFNYFRYVRDYNRNYVYLNWILYSSVRNNGYYTHNNYPYYVYNGYQHRYSTSDTCNYQLVNKNTHNVVRTYWNQSCFNGYNQCAIDRDNRNEREWDNRFFCAETFRDNGYDFSRRTYDYEYEDDLYQDQYGEGTAVVNQPSNRSTCYDYDHNTGICYDN